MTDPLRVIFHVGGATVHPVARQAGTVVEWLSAHFGERVEAELLDGAAVFRALRGCDLLVLMGLHWTGMTDVDWAGHRPYRSPAAADRRAFKRYLAAGRPVFVHHSAIGCYDDWPEFAKLIGVRWDWDVSSHEEVARQQIRILDTSHPILDRVADFEIVDEAYEDIWIAPDLNGSVHAEAQLRDRRVPMVITSDGRPGAPNGRLVYVALGHDLRAFRSAAYRRLWINGVEWLLGIR
jgi:uncharacterized protein